MKKIQKKKQKGNEQRNTIESRKRNTSASNKRSASRAKSLKKYNTARGKSSNKIKKKENNNIHIMTLSNDIGLRNIIKNRNEKINKTVNNMTNVEGNKNLENKKPQQKIINFINCVRDDIILDKRVIQRFFAYSISELYNKHFSKIDFNNNDLFYKILNCSIITIIIIIVIIHNLIFLRTCSSFFIFTFSIFTSSFSL